MVPEAFSVRARVGASVVIVALKGMPCWRSASRGVDGSSLVQAAIIVASAAILYIIAFFITDKYLCYL